MKRKIEWHKVTPLSKFLAMAFFIFFPFLGFYLGMKFQELATGVTIPSERLVNLDPATGFHKYQTENLHFEVDPDQSSVHFDIHDGSFGKSKLQKNTTITIADVRTHATIDIKLNLDGEDGSCPGFDKGFNLTPIYLDGKEIFKAQLTDKKLETNFYKVGNVYLVEQYIDPTGTKSYTCPNVFGLNSNKNGWVMITYNLNKLPIGGVAYKEAEMRFDKIILSIQKFW